MEKLKRWLSSRLFVTVVSILIQFLLMGAFFLFLDQILGIHLLLRIISLTAVFSVLQKQIDTSLKLLWCVLILLFPWIGGIFYFLFGCKNIKKSKSLNHEIQELNDLPKVLRYAVHCADGKICTESSSEYFERGEQLKTVYLEELKKAQHFIFMEYFILAEGQFLSEVLEVLIERMHHGVQIYLIYDDIGCIRTLSAKFKDKLKGLGMHVHVYNPLLKKLTLKGNTRDHRKITVIDFQTAFVGGNNLADEYINSVKKFGYWKDTAVMVKGDGALHCAKLFQTFWNEHDSLKIEDDVFIPFQKEASDGIVVPFADTAQDEESAGFNVHLLMIQNAKTFIDIQTPYLIINDEMKHALMLASKSGIQVRIIVPHLPDRWFVHEMTRSFYPELLKSGVRIFEYAPGFIHSKVVLSDEIGLCGTINMDYRSYVHHHECGVLFYQCSILKKMQEDMQKTLTQSIEIQLEDCNKTSCLIRIFRTVMALWTPLL